MCQFGQKLAIDSEDRVQKRLFFIVLLYDLGDLEN